jgi:uncharacterized protein
LAQNRVATIVPGMRFLCDEMLRGLGRWLRAAGYDTVFAESGLPDHILARRCAAEDRVLVTKDRHLATVAGCAARVVLVAGDGIDANARAVHAALDIDWEHAPFTRCLVDNTLLEPAPPHLTTEAPATAQGPLRFCPVCRRIYWRGGHVRRMQSRLAAWQRGLALPR